MTTYKSKRDVASAESVYAEVNARMIAALMFHNQMAEYFLFLGLCGYSAMHEYQYFSESLERENLRRKYIHRHGHLIPDVYEGKASAIPDNMMTANRMSIGKGTKQKAVEDCFNDYHAWESETKELYQEYSGKLREFGAVIDASCMERMAENVSCELERIENIVMDLIACSYDMGYIVDSQEKIKCEYERKLKCLFGGVKHE